MPPVSPIHVRVTFFLSLPQSGWRESSFSPDCSEIPHKMPPGYVETFISKHLCDFFHSHSGGQVLLYNWAENPDQGCR
jgi:hypothetical protein